MFVRSDGSVSRPPVQWSPSLASVTFTNPHIISHDNLTVSVYDISDGSMKQGLPYTGGRFLGFCDGHILLASSGRIESLAPVPWQQQAASLLESGRLEEAIKMAAEAAVTVLRVDQIIMSKPAGGPKAAPQGGGDDD